MSKQYESCEVGLKDYETVVGINIYKGIHTYVTFFGKTLQDGNVFLHPSEARLIALALLDAANAIEEKGEYAE